VIFQIIAFLPNYFFFFIKVERWNVLQSYEHRYEHRCIIVKGSSDQLHCVTCSTAKKKKKKDQQALQAHASFQPQRNGRIR
jgi:hypothetical protein